MIEKKLAIILGILVLAALPLAAQTVPSAPTVAEPVSTTNTATVRQIRTDVDNFLDYSWYTDVKFDKWFGYAGYSGLFTVGYARNLGPVYLGAWYKGNVARTQAAPTGVFNWNGNGTSGTGTSISSVDNINPTYDAFGELQSTAEYSGQSSTNVIVTDNQIQTLIGLGALGPFGGMAVKVGFREFLYFQPEVNNTTATTTSNKDTGVVTYAANTPESFYDLHGNLQPNVGWGATLALGNLTLRPKFEFAIALVQDKTEDVRKSGTTTYGRGTITLTKTGEVNNFIRPSFVIGSEIDLKAKNGGTWTPGIDYNLFFDVYSNDYDGYGSSDTVKGTVNYSTGTGGSIHQVAETATNRTVTDTARLTISEKSGMYHTITPSIAYKGDFSDRVKFGFKAAVPVSFSSDTASNYTEVTTKTNTVNNNGTASYVTQVVKTPTGETTTSRFSLSPVVAVGTSYQVIPGKLALNAGISGTFGYRSETARQTPNGSIVTTSRTTDENGNVTANTKTVGTLDGNVDDRETRTYAWDGFTPTFGAGLTINFTENFALDAAFSSTPGSSTVNLGSVQLLLSLKK